MIATDGYNNVDQFADGYMEQEEEWEREGLLDPAWEKQQKKVGISIAMRNSSGSPFFGLLAHMPRLSSQSANGVVLFFCFSPLLVIIGGGSPYMMGFRAFASKPINFFFVKKSFDTCLPSIAWCYKALNAKIIFKFCSKRNVYFFCILHTQTPGITKTNHKQFNALSNRRSKFFIPSCIQLLHLI